MYSYVITYSGGEDYDWDGYAWTNYENAFDGDEDTYTNSYVTSAFITDLPYRWDYTWTHALIATDHNNTTDSGTIMGVYTRIYGYTTESGLNYYAFINAMISGTYSEYFSRFELPTTSGSYTSIDITNIVGMEPFESAEWTWDGINALDVIVYVDSDYAVPEVNINISKIDLLVVVE